MNARPFTNTEMNTDKNKINKTIRNKIDGN